LHEIRDERVAYRKELETLQQVDNIKTESADMVVSLWEAKEGVRREAFQHFIRETFQHATVQIHEVAADKNPHGLPNFGDKMGDGYKGFGSVFITKHTRNTEASEEEQTLAWSCLQIVQQIDTNQDGKVDRQEWMASLDSGNMFATACEEVSPCMYEMRRPA